MESLGYSLSASQSRSLFRFAEKKKTYSVIKCNYEILLTNSNQYAKTMEPIDSLFGLDSLFNIYECEQSILIWKKKTRSNYVNGDNAIDCIILLIRMRLCGFALKLCQYINHKQQTNQFVENAFSLVFAYQNDSNRSKAAKKMMNFIFAFSFLSFPLKQNSMPIWFMIVLYWKCHRPRITACEYI